MFDSPKLDVALAGLATETTKVVAAFNAAKGAGAVAQVALDDAAVKVDAATQALLLSIVP